MSLRPYQLEGVEAVYAAWARGVRAPGVSLPTGVGKTHMMCEIGAREVASSRLPVLYLLHRDQLVEQTRQRLRPYLPAGTSLGVVKAERNEVGARVLVASVHTLRSARRRAMLPQVGCCVVDEAHVSVSPTYRDVFAHLGPDVRLAGFSATWSRSDSTGLGDVWQEIVFRRSIRWAIANGHLVRPRAIQVGAGIDLDVLPTSRATGDYREEGLGEAVMLEGLRDTVVRAAHRYAAGRPGALFAPTVASAEYFADALRASGLRVEGIYHDTSPSERARRFADHEAGRVHVLTTCTALAEGWDSPHTSVLYMLRPTKHEGLWTQIAGRTLRPWPGKTDALLLDFVGVLDELSLRAAVDLSTTSSATQDGEGVELLAALDAPDEAEEEQESDGRVVHQRARSREVDLFAGTSVEWQTTPEGVPFVACGERYVYVVRLPGGWTVAECPAYTCFGSTQLAAGLEAEDALEVAADHAEQVGGRIARRSARWRRQAPTPGQLGMAAQLGIEVGAMSCGELSAAIDMTQASATLRPVAAWAREQNDRGEVYA